MSTSAHSFHPWRKVIAAYVFALVITGLTLEARLALAPWLNDRPSLILLALPVIFSAYVGGLGPGLVATAVGAIGIYFILLASRHLLWFEGSVDLWNWVILIVCGVLISGVVEALHQARRRIEKSAQLTAVTLASIGDAVITTDGEGKVTFLNAEAERLTEWDNATAQGEPLANIFRIINEHTREPLDDPVKKVLQSGTVVGLANHTLLLGRASRETMIDDSGAPIKEADGRIVGVVLVFRDCTEKKKAEQALLESQALYRSLVEQMPAGMFRKDAAGRYAVVNPFFCKIRRVAPEQFLGKLPQELPESEATFKQQAAEHHAQIMSTGQPVMVVDEYHCSDGETLFFYVVKTPVFDAEGKITGSQGILFDITQRQREAGQLAETVSLLRATIEATNNGLLVVDAHGRVSVFNSRFLEIMKIPRELAEAGDNRPVFQLAHEQVAEPEKFLSRIHELYAHPQMESVDTFSLKDGRVIERISQPQRLGDRIIGRVWSFRDVTEQRKAAEALRCSEEHYRTLFECSPTGVLRQDESGHIIDTNEAICQMTGFTRDEVLKGQVEMFMWPDQAWVATEHRKKILAGGVHVHEAENLTKDKRRLFVKIAETCITFPDGHREILCNVIDITERKNAEQALRENEQLLRQVIDAVPHFIFAKDRNSRNIFVNRACAEGSGLTVEQMVGRNDLDYVTDRRQAEAFMRDDREVMDGGRPKFIPEEKFTKSDGSSRIFETHKIPFTMPGTSETAMLGVAVDITDRVRAEAAARLEQQRLRTLIDLLPDFIFVKDREGRFLVVNEALAKAYGQSPAAMLNHHDAEFFPAEMAARFRDSEARLLAAAAISSLEDTITFPDGTARTMVTNMAAFRGSDGQVCGLVGIGHDITGQKAIERSMRLQSIALETAANAIMITGHDGNIEWVNPAFTQISGYTLAECAGKNPRDLIRSKRHGREFYKQMWATILAGRAWHGELMNRRKDGSLYQEEMTITPLVDLENRTTHFVAIKQDITERKRLEAELRESNERTKFFMNRMPLGFIAWDFNFHVAEWNTAAETIFGWPAGEAIGRHACALIVPPELQPQMNGLWEQFLSRENLAAHSINDNVTRDGRRITCEWRNTLWHDASGKICGVLSIVQDITEKKVAGEKFAREQARFKLIFDTLPIGIAFHTIHPDGSVTRIVNEAHLQICGLTREQSNDPQNYVNITHPDDRAAQSKLKVEVNASQVKRFSIERRYVHPQRSLVWVNLSFQRETHPNGTVDELITVADITERKLSEQKLQQLAVIVESSEDAIISKTLDGSITSWNRGAENIFGYSAGEAIGKPMLLLFPDELKHEEADILARLGRGESIEHLQTERVRKDGKRIRISATISPLKDSPGQVIGVAIIARDTTHEHILEEQLRHSQKMEAIGQLAGGVAHDFNNILAVIQMQTELAKIAGIFTTEQTSCLEEIQTAANRGANLTGQLLLFSRRQRLQPRELDLSDSITGMTKMLRRVLSEEIQIQFKYAPQPLFIYADAGMMDQVVMNLTLNSRDAMPDGGQLVIETAAMELDELAATQFVNARPGSFVRLSVSDTGCGIPPEILPRIFEPFFTTKEVGKGTGLGLATVFSIVQQHQGWIHVVSTPGRGTTFEIYLPRLLKNAARSEPAPAPVVSGGTETILLVEDDDALRASVHKCLTQLGYQLFEAASGPAALQVWQEHREQIHLLLTDLVMPGGLSGKELGERLRREKPKLKVIYTSGYNAEVFGHDFKPGRGMAFLAKPFLAHTLARMVRDCLDKI